MILVSLAIAGILFALIPAAMFLTNLPLFRFSDRNDADDGFESVSVLIPARDEQAGIGQCVLAALAATRAEVEVIVLDDHSSDATAAIVREIAVTDPRVKCLPGKPLPVGWNGKQHACYQLSLAATHDRLVFLDADVRLRESAIDKMVGFQNANDAALLSAFPHQQTGTILEKMIIPMMHFILLGFLPLARMRDSTHPAYAAGCGQFFMTRRRDYETAGTHAAIRSSRHDGLKLPRSYRESGLATDVIDGSSLAECRMYGSGKEVVRGVLKNAIEGIANPKLIVLFSVLLLGGSLLPMITLLISTTTGNSLAVVLSIVGVVIGHAPRAIAAIQFKQSVLGVLLHSVAVSLFVLLQWVALANHLLGRQVAWRGRTEVVDQAASTT